MLRHPKLSGSDNWPVVAGPKITDPLTAAVCSLDEISRLFDEMWAAERPYLKAFE